MKILRSFALVTAAVSSLAAGAAAAEETPISVRVLAQGAKFIGGEIAGAQVTLHHGETGELLASGLTSGGTGDTTRLMEPEDRLSTLSSEGAAKFETVLDIDRATPVQVTVRGPLNQPQAMTEVTKTYWILPGIEIGGDGLLIELPGLAADLLSPAPHARLSAGVPVSLEASIALLCGCGLSSGGIWDADALQAEAVIYHDGEPVERVEMAFTGITNRFRAEFVPQAPGIHEIELRAYHPPTRNTGIDRAAVFITD